MKEDHWIEASDDCGHDEVEPRLRTYSNGVESVWLQCLRCGRSNGKPIKKSSMGDELSRLNKYDEDLLRRWQAARSAVIDAEMEERRQLRRMEYARYLRSSEWKTRRSAVLARDQWSCVARLPGCTEAATEVHHLTYQHKYNEPLFDLVSVCRFCHEEITKMESL